MKNIILIIFYFVPLEFFGQCFTFTFQMTLPSCPTCCDGTAAVLNLTGGCEPYTFYWSAGYQLGNEVTQLCAGSDSVYIICPDSCCSDYDTTLFFTVPFTTGINDSDSYKEKNVSIYPNPAKDKIEVQTLNNSQIDVFNIQGQKIESTYCTDNIIIIDLLNLPRGVYVIKSHSDKGTITRKFIKE